MSKHISDSKALLTPALRQYQHNNGSGLLFGYEKQETESIVSELRTQLAKANERIAELEKDILRQSVFMEKTAEKLEQHQEWQATANVLRRPTREAKQALNKFAIEQQIKGVENAIAHAPSKEKYALPLVDTTDLYDYCEKLRKEQSND